MKSSKRFLPLLVLFAGTAAVGCAAEVSSSVFFSSGNGSSSALGSASSLTASSSGSASSAAPSSSAGASSLPNVTDQELKDYLAGLKATSKANHLYFHYKKYDNAPSAYADWDLWCWSDYPKAGEGAKFDFAGKTQSADHLSSTGEAIVDAFGGACVDVDLTASYDGGWDSTTKAIGGTVTKYTQPDGSLEAKLGFQVVKTSTRTSSSGFWVNDGSNLIVTLSSYAFINADGTTSYHLFALQDKVQSPASAPLVNVVDPFASDAGTDVTYGQSAYNDVDWSSAQPLQATSPKFLQGEAASTYLKNGAGVGYQILVASFADSDGDGFGDIYGIDQKLDYLASLGVNVLWLTPIQLSDSYHGYDISDYTKIDPKFGSKTSPAGLAANGLVSSATAMEDYALLLRDAHLKGLAVIMDLVLNHTSTDNPWFISSAQLGQDYRGYYQWGNHATDPADINEGASWYPYGDHVYSYYAKFGSSMPELNYQYVSTRTAVETMAKSWCALGVDGFRMDAVKHIFLKDEVAAASGDTLISDVSASGDFSSNLTKNLNFWRELNHDVKQDYPNAFFVGENFDGHAYHVAPYYEGFDSLFDFYSYFNITSAAANARNSSIGGDIQAYDGKDSGSLYSVSGDSSLTNGSTSMRYGGTWDLSGVLASDNQYRTGGSQVSASGYSFLNGAFTSNHDIARCLNRVAGTGDASGLQEQGTLTAANYDDYLKSATCAEIVELMLPGCTWIYYGDELGMSGNFASGQTAADSYADLAYRQPMKWKQGGAVGDGSFTTGFGITGSGTSSGWDAVNASAQVPSVEVASTSDHFNAIQAFAQLKGAAPALIRGTYTPYGWTLSDGTPARYVFNVSRKLGSETYTIVVNFSPRQTLTAGLVGTVAASYNGATLTSLPPLSALAVKTS
jgi:glycosidase